MNHVPALVVAACAFVSCTCFAAEYWVDHEKGDDANPGTAEKPFRTFAKAREAMRGGDTLNAVPTKTPYTEALGWFKMDQHSGTPEKPTVVDGHGAKLSCLLPWAATNWTPAAGGVWKSRPKNNVVCMSGKGHYDGFECVFLNGKTLPFVSSRENMPDFSCYWRFYWDKKTNKLAEDHGTLYLKLPADKTPADYEIKLPQLGNLRVYCNNIVFRNFHGDWNAADFFDTERGHGIVFDNVSTDRCLDQGISSHSTQGCVIRNSRFRRAISCGALDVSLGPNEYQNMTYSNCLFHDMQHGMCGGASFRGCTNTYYRVEDCIARDCKETGFSASQGANVYVTNALVENPSIPASDKRAAFSVTDNANLTIVDSRTKDCQFAVSHVWCKGKLLCERCDFRGVRHIACVAGPRLPGAIVFRNCAFAEDAKVFLDCGWRTVEEARKAGIVFENCTFGEP